MSSNLTPESPVIWPSTVTVPDDTDQFLWEGTIRSGLKDLADRTDYLAETPSVMRSSGSSTETTSSTSFVDVTGTSSALGTLAIGDQVIIHGSATVSHTDCSWRLAVNDGTDTTAPTVISGSQVYVFTATRASSHTVKVQHKVAADTWGVTYWAYSVIIVRKPSG